MTLTDFLLARIAEDEAVARESEPMRLGVWGEFTTIAERVLAECKAKRQIVEQVAPLVDYDRDKFIVMRSVETSAASTLRHLAAVYADHPDYDEEWAV